MGAKATFDPVTKLITLIEPPVGGAVTLDVQVDLYSDAKEDWLNDPNLSKFKFPFRETFGGQDIGGGQKAGAYYFLQNTDGWRIKPFDSDHGLTVNGNLFGVDPDQPLFVPTDGNYTVMIRLNTSSLTQQVGGSGLKPDDIDDITQSIFDEIVEGSETFREAVRLVRANAAGKLNVSGANVLIRDADDTKDRIHAVVDAEGRRTAVTVDGS